jgi:hypothetical protein
LQCGNRIIEGHDLNLLINGPGNALHYDAAGSLVIDDENYIFSFSSLWTWFMGVVSEARFTCRAYFSIASMQRLI